MELDRSPREVPDAVDVAKIACGAFHNLALTRSAAVCMLISTPPAVTQHRPGHVILTLPQHNPRCMLLHNTAVLVCQHIAQACVHKP